MQKFNKIPSIDGLFWYFENGVAEPRPVLIHQERYGEGQFKSYNNSIQSWLRSGEYLLGPQLVPTNEPAVPQPSHEHPAYHPILMSALRQRRLVLECLLVKAGLEGNMPLTSEEKGSFLDKGDNAVLNALPNDREGALQCLKDMLAGNLPSGIPIMARFLRQNDGAPDVPPEYIAHYWQVVSVLGVDDEGKFKIQAKDGWVGYSEADDLEFL